MERVNIQKSFDRYREATKDHETQIVIASAISETYISEYNIYDPQFYIELSKNPENVYFMTGLQMGEFDELYRAYEKYIINSEIRRGKESKLALMIIFL
ncbi:hypothetical protein AYI68_g2706 [Smittium mucronatum]|uniref:Uncharacterized protein n=1 Tax=Smittium mucronatum TaxID=133383 RepID=A0A1R0H1Z6_9FUNG|nr:hypothetical protein AYI68_g2706 [Smittium mucronatum]